MINLCCSGASMHNVPEASMRTKEKLEWVNAAECALMIDRAIAEHGGNRKSWFAEMKKIPDFPSRRTLYAYVQEDGLREKRFVAALNLACNTSKTDLCPLK